MATGSGLAVATRTLLLCATLLLGACAAWRGADLARERREATTDHANCAARDQVFPSDAYTACRRQLAADRLQHQWLELSLAQQRQRYQANPIIESPPPAPYQPLDPRRFACLERRTDGTSWIACGER